MLEFVMALPVVLVLILGVLQLSHIWVARQVVHYAAYCAARACLVSHKSEYETDGPASVARRAAERICAWVCIGETEEEVGRPKTFPGWNPASPQPGIPGSGAVRRKVHRVTAVHDPDPWNVKATVEFDFALVFPIVNMMIGWGASPWGIIVAGDSIDEWGERHSDTTDNEHRYQDMVEYPHMRLTESVWMPKPYVTVTRTDWPKADPGM